MNMVTYLEQSRFTLKQFPPNSIQAVKITCPVCQQTTVGNVRHCATNQGQSLMCYTGKGYSVNDAGLFYFLTLLAGVLNKAQH